MCYVCMSCWNSCISFPTTIFMYPFLCQTLRTLSYTQLNTLSPTPNLSNSRTLRCTCSCSRITIFCVIAAAARASLQSHVQMSDSQGDVCLLLGGKDLDDDAKLHSRRRMGRYGPRGCSLPKQPPRTSLPLDKRKRVISMFFKLLLCCRLSGGCLLRRVGRVSEGGEYICSLFSLIKRKLKPRSQKICPSAPRDSSCSFLKCFIFVTQDQRLW